MDPPATQDELRQANDIRKQFFVDGGAEAYMTDIVRAFRPVHGAKRYVEVGSRDKGNIAWISRHLAKDAVIVDVDLENLPASEQKLRGFISPDQTYTMIEGDSTALETVVGVEKALNGEKADVIFLDSSHMYAHFMREVSLYLPLLKKGGILLFHDALWEGNETGKGKAQAALAIDRFLPVYCVFMDLPVHRILLRETKGDVWGCVGVIIND